MVSQFSSMFKAQLKPHSADESARRKGAHVHGLMIQRLIDEDKVDDADLHALAALRFEAIRGELVAEGVELAASAPRSRGLTPMNTARSRPR
jgi:hypothetical protein